MCGMAYTVCTPAYDLLDESMKRMKKQNLI